MKKLVALCLLIAVCGMSLGTVLPATAQADKSVKLSPCQLDIGLADAKHQMDTQCGVLSVTEDPAKPDGRKIDIHFVVVPATKPDTKGLPIFHFEGGPGGTAITNFGKVWYSAYRLLRENHDIVLIDQRGTGISASLQCTEVTEPALAELAKPSNHEQDSAADLERFQTCFDRLSKTNDPAFYTSTILADDTDAVRAALGYDQIDVFGNSYGTWLGQIYLSRHGEHVHGMVLDSVVGPWDNYSLNSATNFEASLLKVFDLCKADAQCNKAYPDLPGQLQKALDLLDKNPGTSSALGPVTNKTYTVVLTRSRLLDALSTMLYQSSYFSMIPQTVSQAAQGNYLLPANVLVAYAEQADDISLGLYYSVHCSETAPFLAKDASQKEARGKFFGDGTTVESMLAICKFWRSAELDAKDVAPVKSDRPVLILSGAFDPVTPRSFGEETHARLSHSTLAVFPYQGHGPMAGNKCAQTMVAAFFDAPDKAVDTSCTAQDVKPIFTGAYKVELAAFNDPNGKFHASVPKGWKYQAATSDGPMSFFASPDGLQLLGVGIFKNQKVAQAQQAVVDLVSEKYGPVDVQFTTTQTVLILTMTIGQASLDRPDEANTAILLLRQVGNDTTVVWQSAPNNIFQAVLLPVAPLVFASVNAG